MENIIGVNEMRVKISAVLKKLVSSKEPVIITSKSRPQAVLVDYDDYKNLVRSKEQQERSLLAQAVAKARAGAVAAGLTDEDVRGEIRKDRGK